MATEDLNPLGFTIAGGYPESVLEEFFLHAAEKYLNKEVLLVLQQPAGTPFGVFRIDAVLNRNAVRVGIECDGKTHKDDPDCWRDAAILKAGHVDSIYRIPAPCLFAHPAEVWWLLSLAEPWVVSSRARDVLRGQVSPMCFDPERFWNIKEGGGYVDLTEDTTDDEDDEYDEYGWRRSRQAYATIAKHTLSTAAIAERVEWLNRYPTLRLDAVRKLANDGGFSG